MYKAFLWSGVYYPETISLYEDVATIYKTFLAAKSIAVSDAVLYFYRDNPNSILRKRITNKTALGMQEACLMREKHLKNECKSFYNFELIKERLLFWNVKTFLDTVWNMRIKDLSSKEKEMLIVHLSQIDIHDIIKKSPKSLKYFLKRIKYKMVFNKYIKH